MTDEPKAEITLREVYDLLIELKTELAPTPKTLADHESRIRDLEKQVWRWAGAAALLGMAGSRILGAIWPEQAP